MTPKESNKNLLERLYVSFLSVDTRWMRAPYTKGLRGMVLGGLLVVIPLLYAGIDSVEQLSSLQCCLIVWVVLSCMILTVKLGDRFVDAIANSLNNSGL